MKWSYGITTVEKRLPTLFPRTLESLRNAGFDKPRIFVDGIQYPASYERFGLPITPRYPTIRTAANWALALGELYLREPNADRYAVFQDDFVTYVNLRSYLEACPYPPRGYLNLYTMPENDRLGPQDGSVGWFPSNQLGKGAVALVFSRDAVVALLTSKYLVERFQSPNGWKTIDGGIIDAFKSLKDGWKEYVHSPSLVQHTGIKSSMGNRRQPRARAFWSESYDAMDLLKCARI